MDGNDYSSGFDQAFGNQSGTHALDVSSKPNFSGGQDLVYQGKTLATTSPSYLNEGFHDTSVNGQKVSSTSQGLSGETDIHNAYGQEIGEIRTGVNGSDQELYMNHHHVATSSTDVSGNQKIMLMEDPLTKAHEYALMELSLSN
jgi:hypothetical protein